MQRITISINRDMKYSTGSICEKIYNPTSNVWNSDWLRDSLKKRFDENIIINEEVIKEMPVYVSKEEVDAFSIDYDM